MLENQTHREGKKPDELEMVAQACDSRTWEAEVGNGGRRLRSSRSSREVGAGRGGETEKGKEKRREGERECRFRLG